MKYFMTVLVLAIVCHSAPISGQPIITVRFGINKTRFNTGLPEYINRSVRRGASVALSTQKHYNLQFSIDQVEKGDPGWEIDYIEFSGLGILTILSYHCGASLSILAGPTMAVKFREEYYKSRLLDIGVAGGVNLKISISEAMALQTEFLYTRSIRSIHETYHRTNRVISYCLGLSFSFPKQISRMSP